MSVYFVLGPSEPKSGFSTRQYVEASLCTERPRKGIEGRGRWAEEPIDRCIYQRNRQQCNPGSDAHSLPISGSSAALLRPKP